VLGGNSFGLMALIGAAITLLMTRQPIEAYAPRIAAAIRTA
jgi:hypothetical protein